MPSNVSCPRNSNALLRVRNRGQPNAPKEVLGRRKFSRRVQKRHLRDQQALNLDDCAQTCQDQSFYWNLDVNTGTRVDFNANQFSVLRDLSSSAGQGNAATTSRKDSFNVAHIHADDHFPFECYDNCKNVEPSWTVSPVPVMPPDQLSHAHPANTLFPPSSASSPQQQLIPCSNEFTGIREHPIPSPLLYHKRSREILMGIPAEEADFGLKLADGSSTKSINLNSEAIIDPMMIETIRDGSKHSPTISSSRSIAAALPLMGSHLLENNETPPSEEEIASSLDNIDEQPDESTGSSASLVATTTDCLMPPKVHQDLQSDERMSIPLREYIQSLNEVDTEASVRYIYSGLPGLPQISHNNAAVLSYPHQTVDEFDHTITNRDDVVKIWNVFQHSAPAKNIPLLLLKTCAGNRMVRCLKDRSQALKNPSIESPILTANHALGVTKSISLDRYPTQSHFELLPGRISRDLSASQSKPLANIKTERVDVCAIRHILTPSEVIGGRCTLLEERNKVLLDVGPQDADQSHMDDLQWLTLSDADIPLTELGLSTRGAQVDDKDEGHEPLYHEIHTDSVILVDDEGYFSDYDNLDQSSEDELSWSYEGWEEFE